MIKTTARNTGLTDLSGLQGSRAPARLIRCACALLAGLGYGSANEAFRAVLALAIGTNAEFAWLRQGVGPGREIRRRGAGERGAGGGGSADVPDSVPVQSA